MRDPLTWSLYLGRWRGVRVRVHIFFVLFVFYELFRFHQVGELALGARIVGLLWASVLLHEFGHCFAARWVGGQADEILMWPLGGLALVGVSSQPIPQLIATAGGPAVNLLLCAATFPILWTAGGVPLNPLQLPSFGDSAWMQSLGYLFWINWVLLLFNLLPGFPLDGGRLLRCLLWLRGGFGNATLRAVQTGKVLALALGLLGLMWSTSSMKAEEGSSLGILMIFLAIFIYMMAERERQLLEAGLLFDDSLFGYDFSQGYTSLEKSTSVVRDKGPSRWHRWKARRAQLKREKEVARQREEERQVDELLARIAQHGMESLSESERRFLERVSTRYRSRLQLRRR